MEPWQIARRIAQGVVRRRRGLALLTFVVVALILGPAAYFFAKEPPRFRTSAMILVETRPDRVPLFQEFSPFRPLPVQLAILNSRSLAEGVLESLPKATLQDLIDNPYYVDYVLRLKNAYRRLRGAPPEVGDPRRRVLNELQIGRVRFNPEGSDGIVRITAEASKPQAAVDIVDTYIEVLLSRTRSFNIDDTRVTREFLERHVADIRKNLQGSEEALRAFTAGHGGVRLPEQSQAAVTRLSEAQNALAEVTANRKMVDARLQGLREKLEQQKRNPPPPSAAPPAPRSVPVAIQRLRDQLSKLETALIELRTRYTEEHPRVVLVKDQIAELQRELGSVVKETTPVTPAPDAVPPSERVNFSEQVLALELSLHTLTAQEEALRKQTDGLRQSLTGLSRSEMEYSRLLREVDANRSLYALLSDRLTAARIREQGEMKVVKVIDPPAFPVSVTSEKQMKFGGFALLLAAVLGGGVPALVEWVKRPVETEEDVENAAGLPVLAIVPHVRSEQPRFIGAREFEALSEHSQVRESFLFNEAFRTLRVAIQLVTRTQSVRTLLIASAYPGEGKSVVVVNLGLAFREAGRRVVLADTDFHRPTLHRTMHVSQRGGGLVDALHANRNPEQALVPVGQGMWLAPRGAGIQPDTRGILATGRLKAVLDDLADRADVVLCDSSPVLLIPDTLFLASAVDGVILVARAGQTRCRDLTRMKALLENAGARVLGVVINEMPLASVRRNYDRYYKAYGPEVKPSGV